MKAHIQEGKSLFNINTSNPQYAVLQVLNVNSKEYKDTAVKMFYSDVTLNERAQAAILKMGNINDEINSKLDLDNIKAEAEKQAETAKSETGLSDADIEAVKAYTMSSALLLAQTKIAKEAEAEFDALFGEGALSSIVQAQFGTCFTPDLLTITQYVSVITTLGTTLVTKRLGESYSELKKSAEKYTERYNDNV